MTKIYVQGTELELPKDLSFEYTVENRIFSNADGYSFDIEIPLKDSAVNSDIFGSIWDPQANIESVKFPAQIVTPEISLSGIVAIVGVSEETLSIQFLEGRSVQNFEKDLEEVYINELESVSFKVPMSTASPYEHWKSYDDGAEAVAIPWVNNNSGIVQNNVVKSGNSWVWDSDNRGLSYFPFLVVLIRKICNAIGYKCDISSLEKSKFRHLLVCNALPAVFGSSDYSSALPHWTVQEFFENLEIILQGEFNIDNNHKSISFQFTSDILNNIEPVCFADVMDEFSAEIDSMNDEKADLDLLKNIAFKDNGSRFWKLQSCDWFIEFRKKNPNNSSGWLPPGTGYEIGPDGHRIPTEERIYKNLVEFDTLQEFIDKFKGYEYFGYHRNDIIQHNVYYAKDCNCYMIFHSTGYEEVKGKGWAHHFEVFPINEFGAFIVDPEHYDDCTELSTVPVPIDTAEFKCAFLYFSNPDDDDMSGDEVISGWDSTDDQASSEGEDAEYRQPLVYNNILNGKSDKAECFDKLNLGFWEGYKPYHELIGIRPITSNVNIYDHFKYLEFPEFSLRLNHNFSRGFDHVLSIDPKRLYKFSFLSDVIPSVRATYFIKGKRYVCSKLTLEFSEEGMSKLIQGEFYRF